MAPNGAALRVDSGVVKSPFLRLPPASQKGIYDNDQTHDLGKRCRSRSARLRSLGGGARRQQSSITLHFIWRRDVAIYLDASLCKTSGVPYR